MAVSAATAESLETIGARGIGGNLADWLRLNRAPIASVPAEAIAPFPPEPQMFNTSGLTRPEDFASHGAHFLEVLCKLAPTPLPNAASVLDFGIGCGRLARLFKGFEGRYVGADIDETHLAWVADNLPWVEPRATQPGQALPFPDGSFEAVVSISVFSHLTEPDQLFYLGELARVTRPGGLLLLTVHGRHALMRAVKEERIAGMLAIPEKSIREAVSVLERGSGYHFIRQAGHLTSDGYDYGIAFIGEPYIKAVWGSIFESVAVHAAALHQFQDVVVLRTRAAP